MANNPHIIEFDDSAYNAQQCSELLANNDTDEETSSTVEMTYDLENEPNNDIDDSMSINSLLFQNGDTDNEIIEEPDAFNHYPFTSHLNTFGIDHENETGINFLYDMRRVQNPLYTSKYLSTLADVKYGLLFRTFFSGDVSVDNGVNLISYLDLTCHRQLINALDLSQKKNEAIIAPYKDNIEKLFSDLFINFCGIFSVCNFVS